MKVVDVHELERNGEDVAILQNEVDLLALCDHENVTRYLGSLVSRSNLWIAMEFLGGGSAKDLVRVLFIYLYGGGEVQEVPLYFG